MCNLLGPRSSKLYLHVGGVQNPEDAEDRVPLAVPRLLRKGADL